MKHVIKMKTGRPNNEDGLGCFEGLDVLIMKTSLLTRHHANDLVPMPQSYLGGEGVVVGYAFSVCGSGVLQ